MTKFKVGDKVTHRTWGAGEVAFGPFKRDGVENHYLMRQDRDGEHRLAEDDAMTLAAKFKVGDWVRGKFSSTDYTVHAGPFHAHTEWYAVEDGDGKVWQAEVGDLTAAEPATTGLKPGDVVRIPSDYLRAADVKAGDLLVVKVAEFGQVHVHAAPGSRQRTWYFDTEDVERADPSTVAVVDDVAYDLTARYRDRDGDYWTFKDVDGTVRGDCAGSDRDMSHNIDEDSETLAGAVRKYGPLTRV